MNASHGPVVLLTRPREESLALAPRIARLAAQPLVLPTLDTVAIEPGPQALAILGALASFDLAIFISGNAVRHGFALLARHGGWPPGLQAAAVGAATARALREATGAEPIAPADGADSEALLRCAPLQAVAGRRIAIFRGVGGRETLAQVLRARGARVDYVECYQRVMPTVLLAPLLEALREGRLAAVVAASGEGLANLVGCLQGDLLGELLARPVFVQHARVAERARRLGFRETIVHEGGDDGLCKALQARLALPAAGA